MQLTSDKCTSAPNGDCQDIDYNIKTGTQYFKSLLDDNNGDVLLSIGSYNGWFKGMTYVSKGVPFSVFILLIFMSEGRCHCCSFDRMLQVPEQS